MRIRHQATRHLDSCSSLSDPIPWHDLNDFCITYLGQDAGFWPPHLLRGLSVGAHAGPVERRDAYNCHRLPIRLPTKPIGTCHSMCDIMCAFQECQGAIPMIHSVPECRLRRHLCGHPQGGHTCTSSAQHLSKSSSFDVQEVCLINSAALICAMRNLSGVCL